MTNCFLEFSNLLREWRLGDVETLRRSSKMKFFRDSNKIPEVTKLNVSNIHNISIDTNNILDILP